MVPSRTPRGGSASATASKLGSAAALDVLDVCESKAARIALGEVELGQQGSQGCIREPGMGGHFGVDSGQKVAVAFKRSPQDRLDVRQ